MKDFNFKDSDQVYNASEENTNAVQFAQEKTDEMQKHLEQEFASFKKDYVTKSFTIIAIITTIFASVTFMLLIDYFQFKVHIDLNKQQIEHNTKNVNLCTPNQSFKRFQKHTNKKFRHFNNIIRQNQKIEQQVNESKESIKAQPTLHKKK